MDLFPTPATLRTIIEAASAGDRIVLPDARCCVSQTINVPANVHIRGGVVEGNFTSHAPIFACGDRVSIAGTEIKLGDHAAGIEADGVTGLRLRDLTFTGVEAELGTSGKAIYGRNVTDALAERISVENTYGGIYFTGSWVRVLHCSMKRVNLGNIVVAASKAWVLNNSLDEHGYPSAFHHGSGDAITLDDSSDAVVMGNAMRNGYCYGIAALAGGVSNALIANNSAEMGNTSFVYLVDSAGLVISGNVSRQNAGEGVYLTRANHYHVAGNHFYGDRVMLSSCASGKIVDNTFLLTGLTGDANVLGAGASDVVSGNR